ncbi:MAG: EAL domain-containing protein [Actinomycetota bacterium]
MIRRAWRAVRNRSLLQKFGLISLVAFALIGLVLGQMLRTTVERQILAGTIAEAEVVSRLGLQSTIGPAELRDGLTADRHRALQLGLRTDFSRIDIVDAVLWDLSGTAVFSANSPAQGRPVESSTAFATASAGEPLAMVVDLTDSPSADLSRRRYGRLVEVYQPVKFGSADNDQISGVLRTSTPYEPIAATIAAETRRLYLTLGVALLVLYGVLFRLVAEASAELQRRADENEKQARHDSLTGLPNRILFAEELNRILDEGEPESLAVALIDLDRFKEVNDTLGHHHGDLLLIEVGRRLRRSIRPGDAVARFGGDEFALILAGVTGRDAALTVAERIANAIEEPFEIEGLALDIGASIGLALAPDHGEELATLLQRADIAMYHAKRSGGGCSLYDPVFDTNSRQQLALAGDLRRSMADELVVYYQPKVDLSSDRVCGVEALVRWQHPELGLLGPDVFIPLAERGGMMQELTVVVIEQALAQLRRWLDDAQDLHVAVNVSARGLHDPAFAAMILDALGRHGVPADRLVLEITETAIAAEPDRARVVMAGLVDRGVRFSIDDFGTGYSSLAVLRSLPVHELKIDRQFVCDLDHPEGSAIVEYSIQLGHMLGLTVLAEGVEGADEPNRLRKLGCDMAQGYWFARPMPGERLSRWLDGRRRGTTVSSGTPPRRPSTGRDYR